MCEAEKGSRRVECKSCGAVLPSDWSQLENQPCPKCGSDSLLFSLRVASSIGIRDRVRGKVKDPDYESERASEGKGRKKRPAREFKVGSEPRGDQPGKGVEVYRDINRKCDTYDEKVTDEKTGEVLHECHEPLSVHRGHGSAKRGTRDDKAD